MVELRLGKINNEERKFIPTKKDFFTAYINNLKEIEEYELTQTFKDGYKYRRYNDDGHLKFTRNKKMGKITEVIEIDEASFNKVVKENKKCIRKVRKYYHDGDYEIDVDYFSEPSNLIIVEVASINGAPLKGYKPPKGFIEVTGNERYENSNIFKGSLTISNFIIEGSDGVGKTTTIESLLEEGIICQDRCSDVISKNMLFSIPMEERAQKYQDYLQRSAKNVIILVNNDKDELERRMRMRPKLSEYDERAYDYNVLYLETFNYMQKKGMLKNKMFLIDATNLSIKEQVQKVRELILCQDTMSI